MASRLLHITSMMLILIAFMTMIFFRDASTSVMLIRYFALAGTGLACWHIGNAM